MTDRGRKWVLKDVTFKDGGTASGYFTYDAATQAFLDANITVTPGPGTNSMSRRRAAVAVFIPAQRRECLSTFLSSETGPAKLWLQNPVTSNLDNPAVNNWTMLALAFAQPLTVAGGVVPLIVNADVPYTPYCNGTPLFPCVIPPTDVSQEWFAQPFLNPGFFSRVVTGGSVVSE